MPRLVACSSSSLFLFVLVLLQGCAVAGHSASTLPSSLGLLMVSQLVLGKVSAAAATTATATTAAEDVVASSGHGTPVARITSPQEGEEMLNPDGSLPILIEVEGWTSGYMAAHLGQDVLAQLEEGHCVDNSSIEVFAWEVYALPEGKPVTVTVDFFTHRGGQRIGGEQVTTMVLGYKDPFESPPELHVLKPVPYRDADYPSRSTARGVQMAASSRGKIWPNQWHAFVVNGQLTSHISHSQHITITIDLPPGAYRRQLPKIIPVTVMTALLTSEGDVIATSDLSNMWAGDFSPEELATLPQLGPAQDDGTLSVVHLVPTHWTQAKRPCPFPVLQDGSLGVPKAQCPVRGFMAKSFQEGFKVTDDDGLLGYAPPPPGEFRHLWARAPEGMRVTVVITSCGRIHGLRRTINSFLAANTYPIDRYVLIEDSGESAMVDSLIDEFGDVFDVIENKKRMGQLFSIDKAYSVVETEYIFHCEDDWVWNGIPGFVADSISVMVHDPKISTVHLCNTSFLYPVDELDLFAPGVGSSGRDEVVYNKIRNPSLPSQPSEMMLRPFSFSFNPGLRRTEDYRFHLRPIQKFFEEDAVNKFLFWRGFHMARLQHTYCNHLDINRVSRHMEFHNWTATG